MVAGIVGSLYFFSRPRQSPLLERLGDQIKSSQEPVYQDLVRREETATYLPQQLVDKAEEGLGLKKDSPSFRKVKKDLIKAGFFSNRATPIFMGLKLGLALAFPILASLFLLNLKLHFGLLIGAFYLTIVLGYFLPTLVLRVLVDSRQKKIKEGLPDSLDLMVVCVEAGQGMNQAMKRVADEMASSNPILSKELLMVNLEINAGQDREQALRNLAERTGVEEVSSLCHILIQSDRFGTSIAQALKVQSDALRTSRRQKLEEIVAKTTVKLIFPLILFILPAIIVVILGPAGIMIAENLFK
jgi:tight adherence protein C